jgi:hypothetical protein
MKQTNYYAEIQTKSDRAAILPLTTVSITHSKRAAKSKVRKTDTQSKIQANRDKDSIRAHSSGCLTASHARTELEQDELDVEEAERRLSDPNDRVRPFKRSR